ncbi:MAG: hypothetical protein H0T77_13720 [Pyrinomonadaceae bacterium]|nr:hypothetical protein [Pyrinomonadaceae bacterium]
MKFIEVAHPEGGRIVVHVDHITSAHFRSGEGEMKTRLGLDLDERQNELVLFGEEAERAWQAIREMVVATTISQ